MPHDRMLVAFFDRRVKDEVIDHLIQLDMLEGFSLIDISGYSRAHATYSLAEQVAGHRQWAKLEVLHSSEQTDALLGALAQLNLAQGIRYAVLPVLAAGHL